MDRRTVRDAIGAKRESHSRGGKTREARFLDQAMGLRCALS